eukprot:13148036-Heterocapsa_arctica.AAC.1
MAPFELAHASISGSNIEVEPVPTTCASSHSNSHGDLLASHSLQDAGEGVEADPSHPRLGRGERPPR